MIGKQVKGKSFRRVLDYLAQKPGSELIGKNMGGKTPATLTKEFAVSKRLNPRLKKAVYHSSLSLPKTECLDNKQWCTIAQDYLKGMGFSGSQYVMYRHSDRDHDHVHLVASRIRITDGTTVNDSWDYVRSEKLIRELENKYELTPTISSQQKQKRGQTIGEIRLLERTGVKSVRSQLQQIIDEETRLTSEGGERLTITMPELIERLQNKEVNTRLSLTPEGKIKGISYSLGKIAISGTHLGKAYTFAGLQKYKKLEIKDEKIQAQLTTKNADHNNEELSENLVNAPEQLEATQQLQIKLGLAIAPILLAYLQKNELTEAVGKHYRIKWDSQNRLLYLFETGKNEPKLVVEYQQQQMKVKQLPLIGNQPKLNNGDLQFFQKLKIELNLSQLKNRQNIHRI